MTNRILACLLLVAFGGAPLAALDAPTKAEWEPIEAAIEAGDPDARQRLSDLMQGRTWPEGWVTLADLDRLAGDFQACYRHAGKAYRAIRENPGPNTDHRDRVRADAAWLAIHAANRLGRPEAGLKVFDTFDSAPDPSGLVHFRAAESAFALGDLDRSERLLTTAKQAASDSGDSVPLTFRFHEARLYEAKAAEAGSGSEDAIAHLEAAARTYERALSGRDLPNAWFNLGRMQRKLAEQNHKRREEWLGKAATSFKQVLENDEQDADARFELGMVRLDQGQAVSAYYAFDNALKLYLADPETATAWMTATAYRGRGAAQVTLAESDPDNFSHAQARADLERARQLGEDSPDLYNNLLVAYLALQRQQEEPDEELAREIQAILDDHRDAIEPTNLALSFFHQADATARGENEDLTTGYAAAETAADLFRTALGAASDPAEWTAEDPASADLWRFLGHSHRAQAQIAQRMDEAVRPAEPAELRRLAYAAWRAAGDLGDGPARRHYLAHASRDTPAEAYRAGWTTVRWNSFLSLSGWVTVIANYGAAERWRHPVHLGAWAVVLLGLLVLGFKGLLSKPKVLKAGSAERSRRSSPPTRAKAGPKAKGKSPDETLLPDTMITPRKRDRALSEAEATRLPGSDGDQSEVPSDTDTYLPEEAPPDKRAAVSDIAKRLAKDQDDQRGSRPPPRRRR